MTTQINVHRLSRKELEVHQLWTRVDTEDRILSDWWTLSYLLICQDKTRSGLRKSEVTFHVSVAGSGWPLEPHCTGPSLTSLWAVSRPEGRPHGQRPRPGASGGDSVIWIRRPWTTPLGGVPGMSHQDETCRGDYATRLAQERLGIRPKVLEEVSEERQVWMCGPANQPRLEAS